MEKSERFGLVLSPSEKVTLQRLAYRERLPAAAVVRRLIWREAERHGLLPTAKAQEVGSDAKPD